MAAHNELGAWGEETAAGYLHELGYEILARDWRSGARDIDIVAAKGETMVFVEVKTRHDRAYTDPEEAVDYRKRKNLRQAINHFIQSHAVDQEVRFDIISVVGTPDAEPEINHLQDVPLF